MKVDIIRCCGVTSDVKIIKINSAEANEAPHLIGFNPDYTQSNVECKGAVTLRYPSPDDINKDPLVKLSCPKCQASSLFSSEITMHDLITIWGFNTPAENQGGLENE